jgi:hypothetical protein
MMKSSIVCLLIIICCYAIFSPMVKGASVGNGSIISPAAGQLEDYGINGMQPSNLGTEYSTRHYHQGNYSGIGGSFLETTSPTSESTPATQSATPTATPTSAIQFHLPKLDSGFSDLNTSPALQSFTSASPALPRASEVNGLMNQSPSFPSDSSHLGLETLPSFNKQSSLIDKLQFSNFDSLRQ